MNTTLMAILVVIGVLAVFLILVFNLIGRSSSKGKSEYKDQKRNLPTKNEINFYYQKRNLLTRNEFNFYKSLYPIASKRGFILFTKTRLADLIEPIKGSNNWQASFAKISQKHVDFILCDNVKLNPILVIELDDASHDQADRQKRDSFVDQALESAGIPILHTRTADKLEENIIMKLSPKTTPRK